VNYLLDANTLIEAKTATTSGKIMSNKLLAVQ
jgi:hypothetical protein